MIKHRSVLVACGMVVAAPTVAYAQEVPATPPAPPAIQYPFVAVSPAKSQAGEDVLVSVGCPVADLGEVKSMVLDRVGEFEITSEDPVIQGAVAHIGDEARPGFYAVTAICKTKTVTINLEVAAAPIPSSPGEPPRHSSSPSKIVPPKSSAVPAGAGYQVSKIPVGAPQTGGG
ncbi:hypothetical protein AB0N89_25750 [Amycolatopsis sp. NPDC089917]|uniref:hypothetical protein n=1 Tax=Amycolatopsis sp. NPDC089917 TaxID=3155187 RepID=UPI00343E1A6D